MNSKVLLGAFAALFLVAALPTHSYAQSDRREEDRVQNTDRAERDSRNRSLTQRRERRPPPPRELPPEEIIAEAQVQVTAAGLPCQITEAVNPGTTDSGAARYEVACAQGPGYIVDASTPPTTYDCIELIGQLENARERDPAATGNVCSLPANNNALAVIGGWARTAGVTCTIDQGRAVGKNNAGGTVYEVGCNGADGYWLEREGTGWKLTECLQVMNTGSTCRFSTVAEQIAGFQPMMAGTSANDCTVQQMRLMGQNNNGRFIEVKCAAPNVGYITRIQNGAIAEVYPCASAQRIGGGCRLTTAPAPGGRP